MKHQQDQQVEPKRSTPAGYMQDSAGRLVPTANVKPEHLLEDKLVRELDDRARVLEQELVALKAKAFAEIDTLLDLLLERYKADRRSDRGNLTLASYDGSLRVQVAVGDQLAFGPELQAAKSLIDGCLRRWSQGGNPNLETIITDAFDVGKEGKVRVDRILGLRRLSIEDDDWQRAMAAIGDAVRVTHSRRYVRFYRRLGQDQPYVQVPLDIARV